MGGSDSLGKPGIYGMENTPAATNIPGSRYGAVSWKDGTGKFWLFGGTGYDSAGNTGYLNDLWKLDPSTNNWAWANGSSVLPNATACPNCTPPGIYGTLGTPAAGNTPGGRFWAVSWTDAKGNLWLFGGTGYDPAITDGILFNDLWEFTPSTGEWAWMGGSNKVPISPCSPTQNECGQPGVYGTMGVPAKTNMPGGREGAVSWTDNAGNLWLFGGEGFDAAGNLGLLNDLWSFNPSTQEWTWISGSNTEPVNCSEQDANLCGQPDIPGTFQTPSAESVPGARTFPVGWVDGQGNLWLFGGDSYDSNDTRGRLNDLWELNVTTQEWAWMGGNHTVPGYFLGQVGVYGTEFQPAPGNMPGGRYASLTWKDNSGKFWLFGGYATDDFFTDDAGPFNDMWVFDPSNLEWEWVGGPDNLAEPSAYGAYGTLGVPAAGNHPGGRQYSVSWTDNIGNPWLFGGYGDDSDDTNLLNDLWNYSIATFELTSNPASLTVQSGGQGTVTLIVTALNGFNSAVNFACSDLPAGASCSFSPASITPTGGSATTQLTINAGSQSVALHSKSQPLFLPSTLALSMFIFGWRRRRGMQLWLALALTVTCFGLLSGCGGGSSSPSTPPLTPVTSTVIVTGTCNSLQSTVKISLTVN